MTTAVLLAAGVGRRLGAGDDHPPKCLLAFGGRSLLSRHLAILRRLRIDSLVVVAGYKSELIEAELISQQALEVQGGIARLIVNPNYREGSVVSLWSARDELAAGDDVLVMDADVLYDHRLLERLVQSPHANCFLLDRDIEAGEEPVKLCIKDGRIVDFHKVVKASFDYCGESVGFFRFSPEQARRLARQTDAYLEMGRGAEWYEEAIRDIVLESPDSFAFEDITGLPWIEIDFPEDMARAQNEILPRLVAT